jgi:hypothetical protein
MNEQLELFPEEKLQQQDAGSIGTSEANPIVDAEWCFQFFNNEPIVFAWSDENSESSPLTLSIQPIEGQGLNFQQNGMVFKIFSRPISEESKLEREKSKENDVR